MSLDTFLNLSYLIFLNERYFIILWRIFLWSHQSIDIIFSYKLVSFISGHYYKNIISTYDFSELIQLHYHIGLIKSFRIFFEILICLFQFRYIGPYRDVLHYLISFIQYRHNR